MKIIAKKTLERSSAFIKQNCRNLEIKRFEYLFGEGDTSGIVEILQQGQHEDGGFGDGLEPDFLLPDSSPMATTIAFQILDEIGSSQSTRIAEKGIKYFEQHYNIVRKGWYAVPPSVNKHPHAPWWYYDSDRQGTVIDLNWGNPSAEIIGYLSKYASDTPQLNLNELVTYAIDHLNALTQFTSEHEIYCYLRLYDALNPEYAEGMKKQLSNAIDHLVSKDPAQWINYVPTPVDFVPDPHSDFYPQIREDIESNLDYLIETITPDGVWLPNWSWGQYEDAWEISRKHWIGILTIKNLKILQAFGRIE